MCHFRAKLYIEHEIAKEISARAVGNLHGCQAGGRHARALRPSPLAFRWHAIFCDSLGHITRRILTAATLPRCLMLSNYFSSAAVACHLLLLAAVSQYRARLAREKLQTSRAAESLLYICRARARPTFSLARRTTISPPTSRHFAAANLSIGTENGSTLVMRLLATIV